MKNRPLNHPNILAVTVQIVGYLMGCFHGFFSAFFFLNDWVISWITGQVNLLRNGFMYGSKVPYGIIGLEFSWDQFRHQTLRKTTKTMNVMSCVEHIFLV